VIKAKLRATKLGDGRILKDGMH